MTRRPGRGRADLRIARRPARRPPSRAWRVVVQTVLVSASLVAILVPLRESSLGLRRGNARTWLVRGPYLQLQSAGSITVVWETSTPAACSLDLRPPEGEPRRVRGGTGGRC